MGERSCNGRVRGDLMPREVVLKPGSSSMVVLLAARGVLRPSGFAVASCFVEGLWCRRRLAYRLNCLFCMLRWCRSEAPGAPEGDDDGVGPSASAAYAASSWSEKGAMIVGDGLPACWDRKSEAETKEKTKTKRRKDKLSSSRRSRAVRWMGPWPSVMQALPFCLRFFCFFFSALGNPK